MTLRRLLTSLLGLLLLCAQQAAFAHAVSHLGKEPPAKEQLNHSKLCDKCVSFEKLSNAASSRGFFFSPADVTYAQPADGVYVFSPRTVAPFESRAPPTFL